MTESRNRDLNALTNKVKNFIMNRGATLVGIASAQMLSKAPEGTPPNRFPARRKKRDFNWSQNEQILNISSSKDDKRV